jgi:ectoine hydroxylase-related dioxygenase (phytanoyl-CoA dioxygenase family)
MATFEGNTVIPLNPNYTDIDNIVNVLNERGYCIVENAVNFNLPETILNTDLHDVNISPSTSTYNSFNSYIRSTSLYAELTKLGKLELINFVYRYRNNKTGTDLHTDNDTLLHNMFKVNYFTCWSPLLDISLEDGPLCFLQHDHNKDLQGELTFIYMRNRNLIFKEPFNNDLHKIFSNYNYFENCIDNKTYHGDFVKKYNGKFYAMSLKKGDVLIFRKNIIHGALDSNRGTRKSIDFRFGVNIQKNNKQVNNFLEKQINYITSKSSTRMTFDFQGISLLR